MKQFVLSGLGLFISIQLLCAQNNTYSLTDFQSLYPLQGIWKMETKRGLLFEQWTKTSENILHGQSFRLKDKDTMILERIELRLSGGNIHYVPLVTGQNEGLVVSFGLISATNNRFIFENKQHDYPQRIIYHIISKDSVHARIEGSKNGKEMSSDYFYSRSH